MVLHGGEAPRDPSSRQQPSYWFHRRVVQPVTVVHDFGVMIEVKLSMRDHVSQTCFYQLRHLRSVRRQMVTMSLHGSGLPASRLAPFHRMQHASTRSHSSALRELLWLPIAQGIDYKLCLLLTKSSFSQAPVYRTRMLKSTVDVPSLATLCADLNGNCIVPRTNRRIGDTVFSVAAPQSLEQSADRRQDSNAFDTSLQTLSQDFSVQ